MQSPNLRFRAYRDPHLPNRCAPRAAECVERWLQRGECHLTVGPPAPFARPANRVTPQAAPALLRRALREHEPLHLWCYPLALRLQLWPGGWDLAIAHRLLHTGTPTGHHAVRRRLLWSTLRTLIVATEPSLLIGPLQQRPPPAYLTHALRELHNWPLWYLDPRLAEHLPWARVFQQGGKVHLQALTTGGVLIQQLM